MCVCVRRQSQEKKGKPFLITQIHPIEALIMAIAHACWNVSRRAQA
ncbi:hypothetical protein HanPI659440_Chr04g0164841 [Helianthus annuus]|uniref:Uncharacterized protein n=1 Tax=Helianthus annuus TaxID=4232 RepID=A0A9K3NRJ3_HELAN|nr:hypothetical protein HanXRQr2_Chr04g0170081 [Helianthus annuus]KAJ0796658.1 hypothetical protein HanPI659440_Chr04g0164841 [Helianthus annuus]KAJ0931597.1 hypothetical protein HanPSC8_Chr04g0163631 [Helianthus annuus]